MGPPGKSPHAEGGTPEEEKWILDGHLDLQLGGGSMAEGPRVTIERERVVVVTGVSSGIGLATVKSLLDQDCHVFGSVRKKADADRLAAELGPHFTPLIFDVTDGKAIKKAAAYVAAQMRGRCLFGLVNNAGIHVGSDPLALIPIEKLREQLEVNLISPLVVTQAFLPLLGTDLSLAGKPGKVIMMSSIYGKYAFPFSGAYSSSKFGLEGLSQVLRRELMPYKIDVVIVRPGPIRTEIWDAPDKHGSWDAYVKTDYAKAFARTKRYIDKEFSRPDWFLPASAVGNKVWQVLSQNCWFAAYVITPRWFVNWFLAMSVPERLLDLDLAVRFGLYKPFKRGTELSNGERVEGRKGK